jgi:uncharacterized protein (DUF924 family)
MMDRKILADVYRYWFGSLSNPDDFPADKSEIWFKQSDATDDYIREIFGAAIPEALAEKWEVAELTREEQMGLVILLDQFPRNIFRTSGEAFAYDPKARTIARLLITLGRERFYRAERAFLYLPFEHSEDIADQDLGIFLFAEDALSAPESWKERARVYLDFAARHRDLIRKFGRFPHRNVMLGRSSTEEEEAFLRTSGRGY